MGPVMGWPCSIIRRAKVSKRMNKLKGNIDLTDKELEELTDEELETLEKHGLIKKTDKGEYIVKREVRTK
jgi:DNA-binding HxlR family transcriptional regulator